MPEEKVKKPITDEIATAAKDIDVFAGWIKRLENPDPTLRTESGGKGLKLYDEVDRDPHAGSVLQTRYLAVIGKEWQVEAAKSRAQSAKRGRKPGTTQEQKIADFVTECLLSCNFTQACQELLQAILYGFFTAEVLWQVRDGAVVPKKIVGKHPRRFSFTTDRELRLLTLQNMIEGEPLPDRKFIIFTFGSSDNPYGKGLGQKLWWPVWFKKHGVKFWLIFLEKFGMPTAVGKYPPGTPPEQQAALLDAIDAIQNETGVKIPNTMAIELLEATRGGRVSYEALCEYMDKQISKAVLGQTATTEGTPGKLGNEESQENVREDILKADADLLCDCFNDSLIKWLVDYNFPNVAAYPKIWIRTQGEQDLKSLADRDKIIVSDIGVPVGKRYFYETYAIPEPEDGEEIVQPRQVGATVPKTEAKEFTDTAKKKPLGRDIEAERPLDRAIESQIEIDRLADEKAAQGIKIFENYIARIKAFLKSAKSLREARDSVTGLYDELDSKPLADSLADALTEADLIGVESVGEDAEFAEALWGPGLPFEDAISYFNAKALTVAGVSKADLLAEIKDEIIRSMETGDTIDDFRNAVDSFLERRGYTELAAYRVDTIYRTNMQAAYQAGRWRQMTSDAVLAARPYWRYVAVMDASTRPDHAAMHGRVFLSDDPFWDIWYPPNGFN